MTTYTNSTQGNISLSGSTELSSAAINIGKAAGSTISMNDSDTRLLAGVTTPGAQVSFSSLFGKPTASQANYLTPGTFTWYPPAGVTKISACCIGAGGGGGGGTSTSLGGTGGGGGGLAYCYNVQVRPRPLSDSDPVTVIVGTGGNGGSTTAGAGGGASSITAPSAPYAFSMVVYGGNPGNRSATGAAISTAPAAAGTLPSSPGNGTNPDGSLNFWTRYQGGGSGTANTNGGSGGGGAAGYAGNGGTSAAAPAATTIFGGGGCGIYGGTAGGATAGSTTAGVGSNGGTNGLARSAVTTVSGGTYGGGGGGGDDVLNSPGGKGANGAVRIVWGNYATSRQYNNTNVNTDL